MREFFIIHFIGRFATKIESKVREGAFFGFLGFSALTKRGLNVGRWPLDWENNRKLGALTDLRRDLDIAAVLLHDAVGDAQTQSRSLAQRLGREERIKDFVDAFGRIPLPESRIEI